MVTTVAKSTAAKSSTPRKEPGTGTEKPKRAAPSRKNGKTAEPFVNDEVRRRYIEVAAYYIAERRGFAGGTELEDWVQAEQEVDHMLGRQT